MDVAASWRAMFSACLRSLAESSPGASLILYLKTEGPISTLCGSISVTLIPKSWHAALILSQVSLICSRKSDVGSSVETGRVSCGLALRIFGIDGFDQSKETF